MESYEPPSYAKRLGVAVLAGSVVMLLFLGILALFNSTFTAKTSMVITQCFFARDGARDPNESGLACVIGGVYEAFFIGDDSAARLERMKRESAR